MQPIFHRLPQYANVRLETTPRSQPCFLGAPIFLDLKPRIGRWGGKTIMGVEMDWIVQIGRPVLPERLKPFRRAGEGDYADGGKHHNILFPLRLLHDPQAKTKLCRPFPPPFDFGITWSIVADFSSNSQPQYLQCGSDSSSSSLILRVLACFRLGLR